MRIRQYIEDLEQRLMQSDLSYGHGTDNPADDAWYLVLQTLDIGFDCNPTELQRDLERQELALLESRVKQRIDEKLPVAYVVGEAWFAGHSFKIDKRALIPRSPIAELIENGFRPFLKSKAERVLDLCSGSGCIGIACALKFPDALVDLADVSHEALLLAQENVDRYGLRNRVQTIESNLFGMLERTYDLIICNPPYVSAEEIAGLPQEYHHEPVMGLLSEGNGLEIPLEILSKAADYLAQDGVLIMEVGYSRHALGDRVPQVPFLWLEFERGGEGVFMLSRSQLLKYRDCFI